MIEIYAFLAAFTIQILAMSVLYPLWFTSRARVQAAMASVPMERIAQLYPDVDLTLAREQFFRRYRAINLGIAVLGLLLLGWLFNSAGRADWDGGSVGAIITAYFVVQLVPLAFVGLLSFKYIKDLKRSLQEPKRKAVLERRGLFDFVSPWAVGAAVLIYFLFAAFILYLRASPFPGFAGLVNLLVVTLLYALHGCIVYTWLYGKKSNPLETHAGRLHSIGLIVKSGVYSCIACVLFLSLILTLQLLELKRWEPFALSVFFVITTLLCSMGQLPPRRQSIQGA